MANAYGQFADAVYAALDANSTLKSLCTIYNGAPQGAALPYVDIGESQEVDWGTKTTVAAEQYLTIHVWADLGSLIRQVMNQLDESLHEKDLTLSSVSFVDGRRQDKQIFRDADGVTWHGIYRYQAWTQD